MDARTSYSHSHPLKLLQYFWFVVGAFFLAQGYWWARTHWASWSPRQQMFVGRIAWGIATLCVALGLLQLAAGWPLPLCGFAPAGLGSLALALGLLPHLAIIIWLFRGPDLDNVQILAEFMRMSTAPSTIVRVGKVAMPLFSIITVAQLLWVSSALSETCATLARQ